MSKFVKKVLIFVLLVVCLIALGVSLPVTPRAATSLLYAKIDKDQLLQDVASPRIIFVGGSNLSFGMDGRMIEDSLGVRPINTAIHASLGLRYMLNSVAEFIRPSDVVVVVPEYSHFFQTSDKLSPELLRTVLDIKPADWKYIRREQYRDFIAELPKYALTKFKPGEYFFKDKVSVYSRSAFDEYGDVTVHRSLPRQRIVAQSYSTNRIFNDEVIADMAAVIGQLKSKGATVVIAFPSLQDKSFDNLQNDIARVEQELRAQNFHIIGEPEDFRMADSLMFNTSYHLNGEGVGVRTRRMIELLRPVISN